LREYELDYALAEALQSNDFIRSRHGQLSSSGPRTAVKPRPHQDNVSAGELVTSPEEFIFEWEKLLRMIARDLLTVGYTPSLENFS